MIKAALVSAFVVFAAPACAQQTYFASPSGPRNSVCSQAEPCTPQWAFVVCHEATVPTGVCNIQLADGDYLDPEINIYYYRFVNIVGNCTNPSLVRLIGTRPATTLIWVQDHAIGVFSCMRLEGYTGSVTGIAGRQHVIVDYARIIFGNMPGGAHVLMTEFSIASCGDVVMIAGNVAVHAAALKNSVINLPCSITTNGQFNVDFFAAAQTFGVIDARGAQFTGSYQVVGVDCFQATGVVFKPVNGQPFLGSAKGNRP
jgi:hypothetical protein